MAQGRPGFSEAPLKPVTAIVVLFHILRRDITL
jgi:hypothetical protein